MTGKAINLKLVVPTVLAIAFGVVLFAIGALYLTVKYLVLNEASQSVSGSRDVLGSG